MEPALTAASRRAAAVLLMAGAIQAVGARLSAQDVVSVPAPDGGTIVADLYGSGHRAVVLVLGGSAHAQFTFDTAEGDRLTREMLRFLRPP